MVVILQRQLSLLWARIPSKTSPPPSDERTRRKEIIADKSGGLVPEFVVLVGDDVLTTLSRFMLPLALSEP